jgi:hypothetical protein
MKDANFVFSHKRIDAPERRKIKSAAPAEIQKSHIGIYTGEQGTSTARRA